MTHVTDHHQSQAPRALRRMMLSCAAGLLLSSPIVAGTPAASAHANRSDISATASAAAPESLVDGQTLAPGQRLRSRNGAFTTLMQTDGNLVTYNRSGVAIWHSGTHMHPGSWIEMQKDGNLVIYAPGKVPVWASFTSGEHSLVRLQSDGNLVVIAAGNSSVWNSVTGRNGLRDFEWVSTQQLDARVNRSVRINSSLFECSRGDWKCLAAGNLNLFTYAQKDPSNLPGFAVSFDRPRKPVPSGYWFTHEIQNEDGNIVRVITGSRHWPGSNGARHSEEAVYFSAPLHLPRHAKLCTSLWTKSDTTNVRLAKTCRLMN